METRPDEPVVEPHEVTRRTILDGLAAAVYRGELTELEKDAEVKAYDDAYNSDK